MKGAIGIILLVLAIGFVVVILFGDTLFQQPPPPVTEMHLSTGWNNFVTPADWYDTTAKQICDRYPEITTVSFKDAGGLYHSYITGLPMNDFAITANMDIWIYATSAITVTG